MRSLQEFIPPGVGRMSASFPKAARVEFGLRYEPLLKPTLESFLQEPLTKTKSQFDNYDFLGERTYSELKVRRGRYHYTDACMKDGWLMPYVKLDRAATTFKKKGKEIWFFYLWESDKSLWALKFDPSQKFKTITPSWHQDNQVQVLIPQDLWTNVGILDIK